MTTMLEKPTVPSPANMAEITPQLNQGDMPELLEAETKDNFKIPVLGAVATREEYRLDNEPRRDSEQFTDKADANKATLSRDTEDDKVRDELFSGFHIDDTTQSEHTSDEDIDELPEDLKDELGDPDDHEA